MSPKAMRGSHVNASHSELSILGDSCHSSVSSTKGELVHLTLVDLARMVALGAMLSAKYPSLNATLGTTWASDSRHLAIL